MAVVRSARLARLTFYGAEPRERLGVERGAYEWGTWTAERQNKGLRGALSLALSQERPAALGPFWPGLLGGNLAAQPAGPGAREPGRDTKVDRARPGRPGLGAHAVPRYQLDREEKQRTPWTRIHHGPAPAADARRSHVADGDRQRDARLRTRLTPSALVSDPDNICLPAD
jgi:hypothetical protein